MIMDYAGSRYINTASPEDVAKSRGTVMITMTLQYRYTGNSVFGLYSNEYVRERVYSTQIYMRNWDSNVNQFKKDWILSQIGGGA